MGKAARRKLSTMKSGEDASRRSIEEEAASPTNGSHGGNDQVSNSEDVSLLEQEDLVQPLSIEPVEDAVVHRRNLHQIVAGCVAHRCNCYCCNRRYFIAVLIIVLCLIGSALLVLKNLFHQSIQNLLHKNAGNNQKLDPVCLSTQLLDGFKRTTVEDMNLNRVAIAFYNQLIGDDAMLMSGFHWNDEDAKTSRWRPQGVTTMHTNIGFRFALISWYGRKDEGYANRGGRVSFVDVTDMPIIDDYDNHQQNVSEINVLNYRHVLMVDENFCTLANIHAGGIEYQNGTLYVADSREGQQSIIEFDVANDLYEIPSSIGSLMGYQYVLRASSYFNTPIKASFLSYDNNNKRFITGTYARCGNNAIHVHEDSENCINGKNNNLLWFDKDNVNATSPLPCEHYFPEMQGAVSLSVQNETVIWVSSSYGAVFDSHLHSFRTAPFDGSCPSVDLGLTKVTTYIFPPGLEDLHIEERMSPQRSFMWLQTEFGTRRVFALPLDELLRRM